MKIIHCADLHIDSALNANLPPEKVRERKDELLASFFRLVRFAAENGVVAVIIAGDLFDIAKPPKRVGRAVFEAIEAHGEISFFYAPGNHDGNAAITADAPGNFIVFRGGFSTRYIGAGRAAAYGGGSGVDVDGNAGIGTNIDGHKRVGGCGVTVSGASADFYGAAGLYDGLRLNPNDVNLVVMHGEVSEYTRSDMRGVVYLPSLRNKNIDYLALGHYHFFQVGDLDKRGIYCYSGCLEGRGFDESGEKGFVLLEIDGKTKKVGYEFIPFAARRLYEVEVDISNAASMYAAECAALSALENIAPSSLVKLTLTGKYDSALRKNSERLAAVLSERFYFCRIKDNSSLLINPEDYLNDVSLKGEFMRLVMNENISDEMKSLVIDAALNYGLDEY
ncbi:MAG: metallophosphoesterase [Clostridiales bacterium]|jgi:DNA repair exonuclease SbcCD nuclease subunit|nr:metallophosphoesterase [Clostridiales bacterium]